MRGSEKQIKWAEEIRANLIKTYSGAKALMTGKDADGMDAAIEILNKCEYAGDIIDMYKGIKFTGELYTDISAIMACHRTAPAAEGAKFMPAM